MSYFYKRRCSTCDDWYDEKDPVMVRIHDHPEPQSGPARAALMAYCHRTHKSYNEWITETPEGRQWAKEHPYPRR